MSRRLAGSDIQLLHSLDEARGQAVCLDNRAEVILAERPPSASTWLGHRKALRPPYPSARGSITARRVRHQCIPTGSCPRRAFDREQRTLPRSILPHHPVGV